MALFASLLSFARFFLNPAGCTSSDPPGLSFFQKKTHLYFREMESLLKDALFIKCYSLINKDLLWHKYKTKCQQLCDIASELWNTAIADKFAACTWGRKFKIKNTNAPHRFTLIGTTIA